MGSEIHSKNYKKFIFESYFFEPKEGVLTLKYSYDSQLFFEESFKFPMITDISRSLGEEEYAALDRVFRYIHMVCGVSYYKLFPGKEIEIKTFELSRDEANFFAWFYLNGLGEFCFRNSIAMDWLKSRLIFPSNKNAKNYASDIKLEKRYAVAIGGGKDSIVTLEILRKNGVKPQLFATGYAKPIADTMAISGLPSIIVERIVSKQLLELNTKLREIGGYNGHVPISGILAFIFCAGTIFYGYDTMLLSNERSANVGNIKFRESFINHQWSKSFEFEQAVHEFFKKYVLANANYLSFLRPLSEIYIAKIFAGNSFNRYHGIFVSCNRNYRIQNRLCTWCCNCDKCRFVFLVLAPFMNREKLVSIFGKNLFEDGSQLDGFRRLCGLEDFKPFECVGEIEESIYALLHVNGDFKNDLIVRQLREELKSTPVSAINMGDRQNIQNIKNIKDIQDTQGIRDVQNIRSGEVTWPTQNNQIVIKAANSFDPPITIDTLTADQKNKLENKLFTLGRQHLLNSQLYAMLKKEVVVLEMDG